MLKSVSRSFNRFERFPDFLGELFLSFQARKRDGEREDLAAVRRSEISAACSGAFKITAPVEGLGQQCQVIGAEYVELRA